MPANKKYLTRSVWQRFAKITSAILGGFMVTIMFHMALASLFDRVTVIITSTFSAFVLWAVLMVVAFLGKNGWKTWGFYLVASLILGAVFYFGNQTDPII